MDYVLAIVHTVGDETGGGANIPIEEYDRMRMLVEVCGPFTDVLLEFHGTTGSLTLASDKYLEEEIRLIVSSTSSEKSLTGPTGWRPQNLFRLYDAAKQTGGAATIPIVLPELVIGACSTQAEKTKSARSSGRLSSVLGRTSTALSNAGLFAHSVSTGSPFGTYRLQTFSRLVPASA